MATADIQAAHHAIRVACRRHARIVAAVYGGARARMVQRSHVAADEQAQRQLLHARRLDGGSRAHGCVRGGMMAAVL